jgi:uncharacterized protein (DUF2126 family)
VKVSGLTDATRYVVACNGRSMPLQLTHEAGVAVAGVRYRARKLAATLHPTVPVHAPLVFNLIDRWSNRSIGQCTYHVAAPDGRTYTARPVNGAEAEGRRQERFQVAGTAFIPMAAPAEESNPVFPCTLDLRFPPPGRGIQIETSGNVA